MIDQFSFYLQTRLLFGIGSSLGLGGYLRNCGYSSVAVLVDEGVQTNSKYYSRIKEMIEGSVDDVMILSLRGTEEPDYGYLDDMSERVRAVDKLDALIGIGGGSCLDMTKAVAVLRTNPGRGIDYRGFDKVKNMGIPAIGIPTTAGTGSEVTVNAVFTDKNEMKKLGINGRHINFAHAILDAEWTMSCPQSVAISSGMDAMTHALESYMCNKANPVTRIFSREAFRLLYNALPALIDEPDNRAKRQDILLGSYLAGIALYNSGSGIAGAMSYPIGVHFKVPHGIGGGIFLASVVEYNVKKGYGEFAYLLESVEECSALSVAKKSIRFAEIMRHLSVKLGVPRVLDQWGITRQNLADVAMLMIPLQAAFDQNPIPFSATADAIGLLRKHVRE